MQSLFTWCSTNFVDECRQLLSSPQRYCCSYRHGDSEIIKVRFIFIFPRELLVSIGLATLIRIYIHHHSIIIYLGYRQLSSHSFSGLYSYYYHPLLFNITFLISF